MGAAATATPGSPQIIEADIDADSGDESMYDAPQASTISAGCAQGLLHETWRLS
jgi:hypothetical protein